MTFNKNNTIAAFILFTTLITLFYQSYSGVVHNYGLTETGKKIIVDGGDNVSVMQALNDLTFMEGINDIVTAYYKIAPPTGATFDIVGGSLLVVAGFARIAFGLITLPFQILEILGKFYGIPYIIIIMLQGMFLIYFGNIIVKILSGQD